MTKIINPKQTIVALDFNSYEEANKLTRYLDPEKFRLKVGKQLYINEGPFILDNFHNDGFEIFLDLKLHDIPNTVYKALKNIYSHGVWMTNIHLLGGKEMIKAAQKARLESNKEAFLVGVTILTSIDETQLKQIGFKDKVPQLVKKLASEAKKASLDGVVCSAQEAKELKKTFGKDFVLVTPGIRINSNKGDQSRVTSLKEAINNGSDYLVLGREISEADDIPKMIKDIESYIIGK
ncbi:MAG: orotidine-5'-phosphate decarboxylase [Gammaproteobacteria bacterium]